MEEPFTTASETATLDEFRRELNPNILLYTTVLTIALFIGLLTYVVVWYFYYDIVRFSDALFPVAVFGIFLCIVSIAVFRWKVKAKTGLYTANAIIKVMTILVVCGFAASFDFVLVANSVFDFSTPTDHPVVVLGKNAGSKYYPYSYRGSRIWRHKFIKVKSWRDENDILWVYVVDSVFGKVAKGDSMIVATKPGAFGIEYHAH